MKRKIEVMLGHFFLNEEERVSVKKNDDLLGLSPIFTLLFEKINQYFIDKIMHNSHELCIAYLSDLISISPMSGTNCDFPNM